MTRAEPGASRTAARLAALGFEPLTVPMLEIRPLAVTLPPLEGFAALAFTSPNGVDAFAALTAERGLPVFAVGDATAARARAAGFGAVRSAEGALPDLARLLSAEARGPVLAPGAREPAGDLGALLAGRVEATLSPIYEAAETGARPPQGFEALLAHSPRAARAAAGVLGAGGGADRLAVAISEAAAAPLEAAGFAEVRIARAPTGAAVLEALGKPAGPV